MALDDVVPSTAADAARFEEATHRTTRWIDRCIAAHSRPHEQNLFAIVQACIVGGRVAACFVASRSAARCAQAGIPLCAGCPAGGAASACLLLCRRTTAFGTLLLQQPSVASAHFCLTSCCVLALQGGLDERLREISLRGLVERDTPGYAIGGLAGGEDKRSFVK